MSKDRTFTLPEGGYMPPCHIESERALIGSLMNEPKHLFDVRALLDDGEVFFNLECQDIYRTILEVQDKGLVVRPLTVIQALNKKPKSDPELNWKIHELTKEGYRCEPVVTAIYLRELYIKRIALIQASDLITAVRNNEPLDVVLDRSRELNNAVSSKTTIKGRRTMAQVGESAFDRIVAASKAKNGLSGIPTGSEQINRITGGWQRSDVAIPAGRPGSGKTVVLLHHAKHAAIAGVPTSFFSLEIDAEECTNRLISSECLIPYSSLLKGRHWDGRPFNQHDWQKIRDATDYIKTLPIYFYEGGSTDINDLMYAAYDFQQRFECRLTVFDYLQKMKDRTIRSGKPYEVVSSVTGKLKDMNLLMKEAILAGSQLSRAVEAETRKNKRPQLDDLRESGKIEEDGSIVVGLYRDDYYKLKRAKTEASLGNPFIPPDLDNELEYDFLKNRNGQPGGVKLWADVKTNRIFDREPILIEGRQLTAFENVRDFSQPNQPSSDDPPF
jgi:replicative DNA helicase